MREIERKYLVSNDAFIRQAHSATRIAQGYICSRKVTARIRIYGDVGYITFKGKSRDGGLSRFEFERQIPLRCAELLLGRCNGKIEKIRYLVEHKGYTWEVDLFEGDNEGLVVAEVELPDTECQPPLPEWIWKEVTSDYHYRNSYLVKVPYKKWFK
ncbi:MAG: CYTH domain-containing protein [Alistipes sp.]|nr:CYTH domain-containing protein [Alistipes sp.]